MADSPAPGPADLAALGCVCLVALTANAVSNIGDDDKSVSFPGNGTCSPPSDEGSGQCSDDDESDKCKRLKRKIENLRREIYDKRIPDLENNPGDLPEYIGPGEKLRDTVRGHRKLLDRQLRRLRELEARYEKECRNK
ncbi:MAG: hypothetical protein MK130_05805 [Puniceicoccaceae bacterium]|nr:hypothetical protein [Puniceicoccaceae bacterium]